MPKIPLYQKQVNPDQFEGVQLDPTSSVELAGSKEVENSMRLAEIFDLGEEFVLKTQELKESSDKHSQTLMHDDFKRYTLEQKTSLMEKGLNEQEIYDHITKDSFAGDYFTKWQSDNNIWVTQDIKRAWEIELNEFRNDELINLNKIQQEKMIVQEIRTANQLRMENRFDEADEIINNLPISFERKLSLNNKGKHDYYLNKAYEAESLSDIEILEKAWMEDSDISFSAKQSLIKQYRTIKSNYFASLGNFVGNASARVGTSSKAGENPLTYEEVLNSDLPDIERKYLMSAVQNSLIEDRKTSTISSDTVLYTIDWDQTNKSEPSDTARDRIKYKEISIDATGNYEFIMGSKVTAFMTGKDITTDNILTKYRELTELLNATALNAEGEFVSVLSDRQKQRIMQPLMSIMSDKQRNAIFGFDRNKDEGKTREEFRQQFYDSSQQYAAWDEIEVNAIDLFMDTFRQIEGLSVNEKLQNFDIAFSNFLKGLEILQKENRIGNKEATVITTSTLINGKQQYKSHADDIADLVDFSLKPYNVQVAQELREKFYLSASDTEKTDADIVSIIPERKVEKAGDIRPDGYSPMAGSPYAEGMGSSPYRYVR